MGIFSSIQSAFSNPDFTDRLNGIGQALQGDQDAYQTYTARTAKRHANSNAAEIAERVGYGTPSDPVPDMSNLTPVAVQQLPQRATPISANLPMLSPQALALSQMVRPFIRRN